MENKKGFTLVELLAVIIVLAIILAITIPAITGIIRSATKAAFESDAKLILKAIDYKRLQEPDFDPTMIDKNTVVSSLKLSNDNYDSVNVSIIDGQSFITIVGKEKWDGFTACGTFRKMKVTEGDTCDASLPVSDSLADNIEDETTNKNGSNYFVGANPDNWVEFGAVSSIDATPLLWRIIKSDSEGIKIIYEGSKNGENAPIADGKAIVDGEEKNYYDIDNSNKWEKPATLRAKLQAWYNDSIYLANKLAYVTPMRWCIGGIADSDPTTLSQFLTNECVDSTGTGGTFLGLTTSVTPVGLIKPSDYLSTSSSVLCTGSYGISSPGYDCGVTEGSSNNFLYKPSYTYLTLNANSGTDYVVWYVSVTGALASYNYNHLKPFVIRPVINLQADIKLRDGNGTLVTPYRLKEGIAPLDVTAPVITLIGDSEVTIALGSTYTDAGATALDDIDGDITSSIVTTGTVDSSVIGTYTITYNVSDSSGNESTTVTRTVNVADTVAPVITLVGNNPVNIAVGATYTDAGATALDDVDGDITSDIVTVGNVTPNIAGTYTITYDVSDSSGNEAITVTRTVNVLENLSGPGYITSKGVNGPVLAPGMTPIKWNGTSVVYTTETDPDWYNYTTTDKQWANALTEDGSYWVWIPRYAYQIATCYRLDASQCVAAAGNGAGTINVKFLKNTTNTASDNTTVALSPTYSGSTQTNYIKHPAFTFGTTELTGMWVAKFEMTGDSSQLSSIPGYPALNYITLGTAFTAARNMETKEYYGWGLASGLNANGMFTTNTNGVDTHLMKNIEWGAAAYLSQSVYGKNAEIWINPDVYTGCAGTGPSVDDNNCQYNYKTGNGPQASTTGTVYGIYDMSGGMSEFVMGNYNNIAGSSGLTPSNINDKYIDRYTAYSNAKYGDAVYETSSSINSPYTNSWYNDSSAMITADSQWFVRGGSRAALYVPGSLAGAFNFSRTNGPVSQSVGMRVVLLVGSGL